MAYQPWWVFKANVITVEEQRNYLTYSCGVVNKGVHAFPQGISPKVNVIACLKFKLAYNDVTV